MSVCWCVGCVGGGVVCVGCVCLCRDGVCVGVCVITVAIPAVEHSWHYVNKYIK